MIANELYDAIVMYPFTARQLKVVMAIMRKTYGFGKKQDDVSASQIGAMCGISRTHATSTLNQLAGMRVITKSPGVFGSIVGMNKNYKNWEKGSTESVQVSQIGTSTESVQGVPKVMCTSTESVQVDSTESVHTKDNFPKDNKTKEKNLCANANAFAQFWAAYPKKRSKARAQKAFEKLNPSEQLMATILEAIERAKTSEQWTKSAGQFVPYPASWLNAAGWEDDFSGEDAEISFTAFIEKCKAAGEKPISGYRPLLEYVQATGLPMEFVQLAWEVFKSEFLPGGTNESRVQADWRRHFLNYVKKGYFRLWYAKPAGEDGTVEYLLSSTGLQAKAATTHREAA